MLLQLDEKDGESKKKTQRDNAKACEHLPTRRFSKAESRSEVTCAICLDNLRANQNVITLPCNHNYHKSCILKWLTSQDVPTCPTCKAPALVSPDASIGGVSTRGRASPPGTAA